MVAGRAASAEARKLHSPTGIFGSPVHLLRNVLGLLLVLVLPGLIASRWFGLEDLPTKIALIPGLSVALVLGAAVAVMAVDRSPFSAAEGWATMALALAAAAVLAMLARRRPSLVQESHDLIVVPESAPA